MADVEKIAKYIIGALEVDNLKLQKLLYYSQAVFLCLNKNEKPVFTDRIEAWQYGPVVPVIYHKYKPNGFETIPSDNEDEVDLSADELKAVDLTLSYYGKMSPLDLVTRTHNEDPWKNVYKPRQNNEITTESIYEFYKDHIKVS